MKTFGEFAKALRISKELTLREFCRLANMDPSNWSKIERGLGSSPKSNSVLTELATILDLEPNSEDYNTFFDLAAISHIPKDLVGSEDILEKLPVFFRTFRGEKPTKDDLETMITILQKS
jgi:transcriptional regulator with XRE-family HTH domain